MKKSKKSVRPRREPRGRRALTVLMITLIERLERNDLMVARTLLEIDTVARYRSRAVCQTLSKVIRMSRAAALDFIPLSMVLLILCDNASAVDLHARKSYW